MRILRKRIGRRQDLALYGLLLLTLGSCLGLRLSCRLEADYDCPDPVVIHLLPGTCEMFTNPCTSLGNDIESFRLITATEGLYFRQADDLLPGVCYLCAEETAELREDEVIEFEYTSFRQDSNPRYGYGTLIVTVSGTIQDMIVSANATPDTTTREIGAHLSTQVTGGPLVEPECAWRPADLVYDPYSRSTWANIDTTTTFTVVVERGSYVDSATVRANVRLDVDVSADPTHITIGETSQLLVSLRGGRPPYTFDWTPDDDLSADDVADPIASPTSTTTWGVMVSDHYGQVAERSVTVVVDATGSLEAFAITDRDTIDVGETAQLQGFVSGGVPPYDIYWNPGWLVSDQDNLVTTFIGEDSEDMRLDVFDAVDEQVEAYVRISVRMDPELSANPPTIAPGEYSHLITSMDGGGKYPFTYSWSPPGSLNDASAENPLASPTETTEYVLELTDSLGQVVIRTVTVEVVP